MTETIEKQKTIEEFTPIFDRLLVMLIKPEEVTDGGIIIPETAQEPQRRGHVVAAGPGKYADDGSLIPMVVKANDMILFSKYSGTEIKINGYDYLIIGQMDVLGILTERTINEQTANTVGR